MRDWIGIALLLIIGFTLGTVGFHVFSPTVKLPSRQTWELDPQGHGENLGAEDCVAAGRTPYYIYPDNTTRFYEECLPP
jgi:hypothetical protein